LLSAASADCQSPQVCIYRDDLNHPQISGNKLHKLKPYLDFAKSKGINSIISMGGAYSNHLHALAFACQQRQIQLTALVRGETPNSLSNTLRDCQNWGMKILFCPRKQYRELADKIHESQLEFEFLFSDNDAITPALNAVLPDTTTSLHSLIIGEGGSGYSAIESLAEAYKAIFSAPESQTVTHAICATGTGATLAGLRLAAPEHIKVIGIQTVAEGDATKTRIEQWIGEHLNLKIIEGHLGGFAKMPQHFLTFIDQFEQQSGVPLDPVYNGKVLFKLKQMIDAGEFRASDQLLVLHTGGLQGKPTK
jgi:1-aminocyclopropane-1-carboxylate deaminase